MRTQASRKVPSVELQGEGSYVVITSPKVRELKLLRTASPETGEDYEALADILKKHVLEWTWTDENDNPLPLPKDDPSVIDELSNDEAVWFVRQFNSIEHLKN